jgi:alpha-L-rhamnosidase
MYITQLRTNHIENPLGFELEPLRLSWITESSTMNSSYQAAVRV